MTSVFIGCDHAGFALKQEVMEIYPYMLDVGCYSEDPVDYTNISQSLVSKLRKDPLSKGILICGTGIGMSMAANRFSFVRASLCQSSFEAKMARNHNDANVLCLGARIISKECALSCVEAFLSSSFLGGHHTYRVEALGIFGEH